MSLNPDDKIYYKAVNKVVLGRLNQLVEKSIEAKRNRYNFMKKVGGKNVYYYSDFPQPWEHDFYVEFSGDIPNGWVRCKEHKWCKPDMRSNIGKKLMEEMDSKIYRSASLFDVKTVLRLNSGSIFNPGVGVYFISPKMICIKVYRRSRKPYGCERISDIEFEEAYTASLKKRKNKLGLLK